MNRIAPFFVRSEPQSGSSQNQLSYSEWRINKGSNQNNGVSKTENSSSSQSWKCTNSKNNATKSDRYFTLLRTQNKYTPFFVHSIAEKREIAIEAFYIDSTLSKFKNGAGPDKSSRPTATFLTLSNQEEFAAQILHTLLRTVPPHYVFAHINWTKDAKYCYKYYNMAPGTAKLFLFSLATLPQVFLASVASSASIQLQALDSIAQLDLLWDTINQKNLNKCMLMISAELPANWTGSCGPDLQRFQEIEIRPIAEYICTLHVLGDKHNFTYAEVPEEPKWEEIIGDMSFVVFLTQNQVDYQGYRGFSIFSIHFEELKFAVVTKFPSNINSVFGVFSPFDRSTWVLVLISCVTITLVIQFQGRGVVPGFTFLHIMGDFCRLVPSFSVNLLRMRFFGQSQLKRLQFLC
ncbi:hypothetical protein Fcan01_15994 [Folsomia candida]|uniref:Uncharacterized protein n=1 Tax=Folsomia candida TaxID=158441 RepID=A0A226DV98_FOLCA|nr:hypothetical protein Fcan01_15994 [Folsomia candida]